MNLEAEMSGATLDAFNHRLATRADLLALEALMTAAIRGLIGPLLNPAQLEASFEIMGVDSGLIDDGTYFVVAHPDRRLIGCGGWSARATLFGGDHSAGRDASLLDPATAPARIRAMYTHPEFARRGIGRWVLTLCEDAARTAGFKRAALVATVAGEPLYRAAGYELDRRIAVPTARGTTVPCAEMSKAL
jgi:GNAT superfamily N-acetyltransferase